MNEKMKADVEGRSGVVIHDVVADIDPLARATDAEKLLGIAEKRSNTTWVRRSIVLQRGSLAVVVVVVVVVIIAAAGSDDVPDGSTVVQHWWW